MFAKPECDNDEQNSIHETNSEWNYSHIKNCHIIKKTMYYSGCLVDIYRMYNKKRDSYMLLQLPE